MGRKPNLYMSESSGWLHMLRISNAPTIVSNVMAGVALAYYAHNALWAESVTYPTLQIFKPMILVTVVLLLLYFSGMVLNDAFDAKRDKVHRPERPIPRGIINVKQAWLVGWGLVVVAVLLAFGINLVTGMATAALAISIILYTFFHQSTFASIPLMAICRGLVYVVAFTAFSTQLSPVLYIFCGAIIVYTAVLTLVGSVEHENQNKLAWSIWLMLIPAGITILLLSPQSPIAWFAFCVFGIWTFMAWRRFQPNTYAPISGMHSLLAGFALLDVILIASIGEFSIMITSVICFALTVAAHRKILGS
jgi:4-hydroxybenzoate polyprenyltransferase